jgi:hypothetical protein
LNDNGPEIKGLAKKEKWSNQVALKKRRPNAKFLSKFYIFNVNFINWQNSTTTKIEFEFNLLNQYLPEHLLSQIKKVDEFNFEQIHEEFITDADKLKLHGISGS